MPGTVPLCETESAVREPPRAAARPPVASGLEFTRSVRREPTKVESKFHGVHATACRAVE